ncbi:MerR family transcriptional regulator [Trichococcus ilyis]|uniref:DNA-binding transcriptional regulator, MerR family n=1 Tax=Trichococcus ilyis TaxID=640938 RepID=A0A143YJ32_9LACT|nr:MerR family transcriptional regulator [Trichococcus ilyis]CZQ90205.1 helix turn helix mercury resistance [Trichococcus ilyis]SEJ98230.1 DNA-binding transcriptional regulator, MerR family [Trichococcus ilyis]
MNISEVAKLMDLTPATLRYYEREGLIPPVARKDSGIRDYRDEDLGWIEFIKCMRSAGLSVESLIEYTALFKGGSETAAARKDILIHEREKLIAKHKEIGETIARLDGKIEHYEGELRASEQELLESTQP